MIRLFYVSTAALGVTDDDTKDIAATAAEKNARLGITGALAFNGVNFAQVLEGEQAVVEKLLENIKADTRHSGLIVVDTKTVTERAYDGWSMKLVEGLSFDEFMAVMLRTGDATAA